MWLGRLLSLLNEGNSVTVTIEHTLQTKGFALSSSIYLSSSIMTRCTKVSLNLVCNTVILSYRSTEGNSRSCTVQLISE